jgi:glutamate racemase
LAFALGFFMKALEHFIVIFIVFFSCHPKDTSETQLNNLFDKEEVTILVTDSGLGGLSVAADLASRLPNSGIFQNVRIVFFNALFHSGSGYNFLPTKEEKVRIFNIILEAMDKKYNPDIILIACNTLSVIYDQTSFSEETKIPVIGIVETGVELIAEQFDKNPDANAIIFATQTTIDGNSHKNMLSERGYKKENIIDLPCSMLANYIEEGANSEMTTLLISEYVSQALSKIKNPKTSVFASLNCTHYGYSMDQFKQAFKEAGYSGVKIINPNPEMSNFLFDPTYKNHYSKTEVIIEVVSKIKITEERIASIGKLVARISPKTAEATKNYLYHPNLFYIEFDSSLVGF